MKISTVSILGIKVARMTPAQVMDWLDLMVGEGTPRHIVTANAEILYQAHQEPEFSSLLKKADLITADGIGVVWAAKYRRRPVPERVTGIDLVQTIFQKAEEKNWGLYFLGARPEVVEKAVLNTLGKHTRLRIAGFCHGYFSEQEIQEVVANIQSVKPDILLVALGAPKQEEFIRKYLREMQVPISIGVGGTFDVLAGAAKRAPRWAQRLGMEWLYRLVQNPRRFPRVLSLPKFVWAVLKQGKKDKHGSM